MSDVLYKAIKYMNAEDMLLAREEKPRKRGKTGGYPARQGMEDGLDWRTTGRQTFQAPHWEVHKFHPLDCPDRSSLDADQR